MRRPGFENLRWCEALEDRLLLAAGDLVANFGTDGVQIQENSGPALAMAVQPGGKIVIAQANGELDRYNSDGSRDYTFGVNGSGQVVVSFEIAAIVVDPAGKIILGGSDVVGQYSPGTWYVSRLNADGSFDQNFNGFDAVAQSPASYRQAPASTLVGTRNGAGWLALQNDGKVILGGFFSGGQTDPSIFDPFVSTHNNVDLIRFNADGKPDATFGDHGDAITQNGDWTSYFSTQKLFIRPDGQIVITGAVNPALESIVSYQTVFDSRGRLLTSGYNGPGGYISAIAEAMLPDGTVVSVTDESYGQPVLDFDGRQINFDFNGPINASGRVSAALATRDSKLLIAADGAVARVDANGRPDLTFGFGGTSTIAIDPFQDGWSSAQSITALAETDDGNIVLAGTFRGGLFLAKLEGGSNTAEQSVPRASVEANYFDPNRDHTNEPLSLQVRFYGEHPIDVSTIDEQDILVTGPNGYSAIGKFSGRAIGTVDQSPFDFALDVLDPGAGKSARGVYTVHLVGRVADVAGHAAAVGVIGTFDWPGDLAANFAPNDAPFVVDLIAPYGPKVPRHFVTFSVRLHSPAGIDLSSLADGNFVVRRGDGISTDARLLSLETSIDGATCIATYRVGAPGGEYWDGVNSFGHGTGSYDYTIYLGHSPLDNAGHTLLGYYPGSSTELGRFTNLLPFGQPVAELAGVDPPIAGKPITFRIRYVPTNFHDPIGNPMDLNSLRDQAVSVVPLNGEPTTATWGVLVGTQIADDGTVLATYAMPDDMSSGLVGIRVGGAHDVADYHVPGGLLGSVDLGYANRRPSATLLTAQATASSRGYVSFAVRYGSLAGMNEAMLGNGDALVSGPDGTFMRTRLSAVVDRTDATGVVVSYYFRMPAGASGAYHVTMAAKQVRDLFGRRVSGGELGVIDVMIGAGVQRRIEVQSFARLPTIEDTGFFAETKPLRVWD